MVLSSKPQIEREAGGSPLEAHTPLQHGPAKVTGWEGRDGTESRCPDARVGGPLAGPKVRPALTLDPSISEPLMVRPGTHGSF